MYTVTKLHLNHFEKHSIPSPRDLYARFGMTTKTGGFSGDDSPKTGLSKVEQINEVQKLAVE